jgi:putative ABC transport system permease protein
VTARDTASIALRGLARHWVRASLNVLGILAGVAAVFLLIAVARGAEAAAKSAVQGLGANLVVVYPSGVSTSGVQLGLGTTGVITPDDVTALGNPAYVPDGVQAIPTAGVRGYVVALSRSWQTDVLGSTDGFAYVRGYQIAEGRFFDAADQESSASVIVLGQTVASSIFPGVDPVGQLVQVNQHPFRVIGLFGSRGYSGSYNLDDLAVMPITSAWSYLLPADAPRIQQVFVQATSPNTTQAVATEVTNTLLQLHHITDPSQADFQVSTQQDLLSSSQRLATVMKWMLGVVAGISLLMGGIGIMSLMLSSVGERTREIGIRRAVGARRTQILRQFLIEALLLAVAGGVIGIVLGIGASTFMADVFTDLPAPVITMTAVLIAGAVALVIGIAAGLYPALRAARMQPADAVRRF